MLGSVLLLLFVLCVAMMQISGMQVLGIWHKWKPRATFCYFLYMFALRAEFVIAGTATAYTRP